MRLLAEALHSYARTRRWQRAGLSRADLLALQAADLARWLRRDLPQVAAFAAGARRLADLPLMDKASLMADFARYNRARLSADQVAQALRGPCQIGALTVGASTGTSGNRGYFVVSDKERYRWLGALLAKAMAGLIGRAQRVAVILPQDTRLYAAARAVPGLQLRFFPLTAGIAAWRAELEAFAPSVIVAPPKVLRHLAETAARLAPLRVFSAAETLDPVDRAVITAAYGAPLGQIYMATEGLLGVSCAQGTLHLAEDSVLFEHEPVGAGLVSPVISSFRRQEQIMARYRMNDLLRLQAAPCACGSPLQAVAEVVGRRDDCFRFGAVLVTPDILRNAVLLADGRITDFRLIQTAADRCALILPETLPAAAAQAAAAATRALLAGLGVAAEVALTQAPLALDVGQKLRRVRCALPPR